MYVQVRLVLEEHQAIWDDRPVFVSIYQRFVLLVDELGALEDLHANKSNSITELKEELLNHLMEKAYDYKGVLSVYAKVNDLKEMFNRLQSTKREFNSGRTKDMMIRLRAILNELQQIGAALQEYGITVAEIDAFAYQIQELSGLIKQPRKITVKRSHVTEKIAKSISNIDVILHDELDPLVKLFRSNQPEFVANYRSARKIVDVHPKGNPRTDFESPERDDGL